jgi:uncharacterized protein
VRYWDASALIPLMTAQGRSAAVMAEVDRHPSIVTWWGTKVECASALARLQRDGKITPLSGDIARIRFLLLSDAWDEIEPSDGLRQTAIRVVRTHPLRAGDALQLAAALAACEGDPASLPFVTLDDRLAEAASREGFPIVWPGSA